MLLDRANKIPYKTELNMISPTPVRTTCIGPGEKCANPNKSEATAISAGVAEKNREPALDQDPIGHLLSDQRKCQHKKQHSLEQLDVKRQPGLNMVDIFWETGFGP
jgi:hypothetical protein